MKKLVIIFMAAFLLSPPAPGRGEGVGGPFRTDVFVSGRDGYHTYRIPALVVTNEGTLLAFCEGRKISPLDHGFVHLLVKRSLDNGRTWSAQQVIHKDSWHTIGNPAPVVDRETGTVWLPFCRDNHRVFVTMSTDHGLTWAEPREITDEVKRKGWGWYATGPGHGIQLESGRLLIPSDHGHITGRYSHMIYSDDGGRTWNLGGILERGTDECMAVETADNVYLTMRNFKKKRAYAWSKDEGLTWSPVRFAEDLVGPICQASIVRLTDKAAGDKSRILFLNPASTRRERLTIRLSYDEARTWPVSRLIHPGRAAYSDMAVLPDMSVGCLYENGESRYWEKITFARLTLEWITAGKDSLQ